MQNPKEICRQDIAEIIANDLALIFILILVNNEIFHINF